MVRQVLDPVLTMAAPFDVALLLRRLSGASFGLRAALPGRSPGPGRPGVPGPVTAGVRVAAGGHRPGAPGAAPGGRRAVPGPGRIDGPSECLPGRAGISPTDSPGIAHENVLARMCGKCRRHRSSATGRERRRFRACEGRVAGPLPSRVPAGPAARLRRPGSRCSRLALGAVVAAAAPARDRGREQPRAVSPGCSQFQGSVKERPGTGLAMRATAMKKLTWPIANMRVASALGS